MRLLIGFVPLLILLFIDTLALTAGAIWKIVHALARAMGIQITKSKIYQVSAQPGVPEAKQNVKNDGVIVDMIATYDEFTAFQKAANESGVWLANKSWKPFGLTRKFIYSFLAVNKREPGK